MRSPKLPIDVDPLKVKVGTVIERNVCGTQYVCLNWEIRHGGLVWVGDFVKVGVSWWPCRVVHQISDYELQFYRRPKS